MLERNNVISMTRQTAILKSLAQEYLDRRAPDQLAFGRVHLNTDYAHIHLMISSNGIRSSSRKRLSRARFAEIQREGEPAPRPLVFAGRATQPERERVDRADDPDHGDLEGQATPRVADTDPVEE